MIFSPARSNQPFIQLETFMSNARQEAIKAIAVTKHKLDNVDFKTIHVKDIFGSNVFSEAEMQARLPKPVFKSLHENDPRGVLRFDPAIADAVAAAMKDWAMEHGATHYTHLFQPMTGITAEKHDSFLTPEGSAAHWRSSAARNWSRANPMPAASPPAACAPPSKPAAIPPGIRPAPLTSWSIPMAPRWSSPPHSSAGPAKRSTRKPRCFDRMDALSTQAIRILKLFGNTGVHKVFTTVGAEQEYFLIDKTFLLRPARPDRHRPHAFRRHAAQGPGTGRPIFRRRFPSACWRSWPTAKTNSSSSAFPSKPAITKWPPASIEIAPIFENSNLATDHQNLIMEVMRATADKYGLVCLLHEKPFAGINGTGKHNNWSMSTDTGENLLNPGDTPHDNAQFLVFCAAVIRAVAKYSEILRLSIASRPTTITAWAPTKPRRRSSPSSSAISSPTFSSRSKKAPPRAASRAASSRPVFPFFPSCPGKPATATAPARLPSPATSSSSAPSVPAPTSSGANTVLNTIVAEILDFIATKLEADVKAGKDLNKAIQELLPSHHQGDKKVLFNGNGYAEEWHAEAAKRGLPNLKNTVDVLPVVTRKDTIELFTKYKVYTEKELTSRFNILSEAYVKAVNIEAQTAAMMAKTFILPAALRYPEGNRRIRCRRQISRCGQPRRCRIALHDCQLHQRSLARDRRFGQSDQPSWRRRSLCPRQTHA